MIVYFAPEIERARMEEMTKRKWSLKSGEASLGYQAGRKTFV